jgi:hypothetical protein
MLWFVIGLELSLARKTASTPGPGY